MDFRDKGVQTQLSNIEAKTGLKMEALMKVVGEFGLLKHGEKRSKLQEMFGLSFVHADTVLLWCEERTAGAASENPADDIYVGGKAHLRPIHDAFIARLVAIGPFELVAKKGYVSLRLGKQFCTIGPSTNTRVEVGINSKTLQTGDRLRALPPGKLCPMQVSLTDASEVDDELVDWIAVARKEAAI